MVPRWVVGVLGATVLIAAIDGGVFLITREGTPEVEEQSLGGGDVVAVIDPETSRIVDRVHVGHTPTIIAAGYGGAWLLNNGEGTVMHIDARSHDVVDTLRLDVTATDLTIGAGGLWFAGRPRGDVKHPLEFMKLERIDP